MKIALDITELLFPKVPSAGAVQLTPQPEVQAVALCWILSKGVETRSAGIAKGIGYNISLLKMQFCGRDLERDTIGSLSFSYLPWHGI